MTGTKLEDLKNKEFEITEDGLLKVVEKKVKFSPKEGESYWYVDSYGYVGSEFEYDEWFIKHKTLFRTREEVQQYKRYLDVLDKYKHDFSEREWKDCSLEKWSLFYHVDTGEFDCSETYTYKSPNCIYFKSLEAAEAFIKEAGTENIKKFMFDVWD